MYPVIRKRRVAPLLEMVRFEKDVLHIGGEGPACPVKLVALEVKDEGGVDEEGVGGHVADGAEDDVSLLVDMRERAVFRCTRYQHDAYEFARYLPCLTQSICLL